jgi:phage tail-like protein
MTETSSYVKYIPPVLWSAENDPAQFLGRMLRIFEKILTGISIDTQVQKSSAAFIDASSDHIQLVDPADAVKFLAGDWITIEGAIPAEREQIDHVLGDEIFLAGNLLGVHAGGIVRIADLEAGQRTFRVRESANLGSQVLVRIKQAATSEIVQIEQISDGLVKLTFGLANAYALADSDVPVRVLDGLPIDHDGHQHPSLEETIDRLHLLSNPWHTRADFLPWLASWVALTLDESWSEFQQRKLISEMVSIYRQRGLKRGLHTYLDIFAFTQAKPRIAIDDGEACLRATFQGDGHAKLHAVAQSNTVTWGDPIVLPGDLVSVLVHPIGIGVDSYNDYIIADQGDTSLTVPRPPTLWRISSSGDVEYSSGGPIPMPQPLHAGAPLKNPTAVVVDALDRYNVVDFGSVFGIFSIDSAIYRFEPPAYTLSTVIDQLTVPSLPAVRPVDMILDSSSRYILLDRGGHLFGDPPAGPSVPKILVVSEGPLAVDTHAISSVTEPTAIVEDSLGRFIVADAMDQTSDTPADLVLVDPSTGWSETSLLGTVPPGENPLIFPSGLGFESEDSLLVCDIGVRRGYDPLDPEGSDSAYRYMAEPAAIYRVDLSQAPPVITKVTEERHLVNPSKMVFDRTGKLIITDRGDAMKTIPNSNWRAELNEFGVVVHFSRQRPTTFVERNRIRRGIIGVIDEQKPSHASWWMDF